MPHNVDQFGRVLGQFADPLGHPNPVVVPSFFVSPPGDGDLGGFLGGIIDIGVGILTGGTPGLPSFPQAPGGPLPPLPTNGPFILGGAIPPTNGCAPNPCCSGQHLNKSRTCSGLPPGSKCVTNRRMNSLNPRALRRATRRLKGFERAVKSTRKQLRTLAKI